MYSLVIFVRWYDTLNKLQKVLAGIGAVLLAWMFITLVTHEPKDRIRPSKIILNCDHCGTDPERSMTYNEYQDQKEQQQRSWFNQQKQRIQQEIWDEKGRQRWCREHPRDRNCN